MFPIFHFTSYTWTRLRTDERNTCLTLHLSLRRTHLFTQLYAAQMPTTADIYNSLLQRGQSALPLPIQARVPWRSSNDKTAHGSTTHWQSPDTPSFGITVSPLIYSHKWNVWVETSRQSHPNSRLTERQRAGQALLIAWQRRNKRQKAVGMPNKY